MRKHVTFLYLYDFPLQATTFAFYLQTGHAYLKLAVLEVCIRQLQGQIQDRPQLPCFSWPAPGEVLPPSYQLLSGTDELPHHVGHSALAPRLLVFLLLPDVSHLYLVVSPPSTLYQPCSSLPSALPSLLCCLFWLPLAYRTWLLLKEKYFGLSTLLVLGVGVVSHCSTKEVAQSFYKIVSKKAEIEMKWLIEKKLSGTKQDELEHIFIQLRRTNLEGLKPDVLGPVFESIEGLLIWRGADTAHYHLLPTL